MLFSYVTDMFIVEVLVAVNETSQGLYFSRLTFSCNRGVSKKLVAGSSFGFGVHRISFCATIVLIVEHPFLGASGVQFNPESAYFHLEKITKTETRSGGTKQLGPVVLLVPPSRCH